MSTSQLVVFSLGDQEYALPIASVSEIIRHVAPRTVASEDPGVRGVIGLRGKIIPIVDLAGRLGLAPTRGEPGDAGKIIILDIDDRQTGVIVDEVDEVLTISDDDLDSVPTAGSAIEAVAKVEERLVMLLDPASLFADPVAAAD
jgi:purine-binding chemotaxis protein CheW